MQKYFQKITIALLLSFFAVAFFIVPLQSAFGATCDPYVISDQIGCNAYCKTTCMRAPGTTDLYCCPKGCLGTNPCASGTGLICLPNPLNYCDIGTLIEDLANLLFMVGAALTPLMIIVAGFYFMTAAGDPGKIKTAKDIILYTVIGFAILLLARAIIYAVQYIITG